MHLNNIWHNGRTKYVRNNPF